FFSSRRRHTRFSRDWSSDVCSSDLVLNDAVAEAKRQGFLRADLLVAEQDALCARRADTLDQKRQAAPAQRHAETHFRKAHIRRKIGRASCRERGKIAGGRRPVENQN